jgi:cation/acetate symporter
VADIQAAEKALAALPKDEAAPRSRLDRKRQGRSRARAKPLAGMPRTQPSSRATRTGEPRPRSLRQSRRNFLALVFCLMVGTAALPHILMRYYTTPSVKEARESVTWSLFFIFLLYFTAPALAVLVKYEVFTCWWARRSTSCRPGSQLDQGRPGLLSVVDINKDGILQLAR